MGEYTEAQGLMKIDSTILDLVGSNQFCMAESFLTKSIYPINYNLILENPDHT